MSTEQTVTESQRLDRFVAEAFGISRSQAAKRIADGCIRCNGIEIRKASKNVKSGDSIKMTDKKVIHHNPSPSPNPSPIPILYEDSSCIVANKPSGLTVHPAQTTKDEITLIEILREKYDNKELQLVHRLDKDTTGCILIAKTPEAHEKLQEQFKNRSVQKVYFAIVAGVPKEKKATIDAEIGRSLVNRMKMSLFRTGNSRRAITTYEVLSHTDEASLLKCTIETGRTHQIRVHLSSIGHPILGDDKYSTEASRTFSKKLKIEHPLLHAGSLKFISPETSNAVKVVAPIPDTFKKSAHELRVST